MCTDRLLIICSLLVISTSQLIDLLSFNNYDQFTEIDRLSKRARISEDRLREIDEKWSHQFSDQFATIARRIDALESSMNRMRRALTHDWIQYGNNDENATIMMKMFDKMRIDWHTAEDVCESFGGHLVNIDSDNTNQFVYTLKDCSKVDKEWTSTTISDATIASTVDDTDMWIGLRVQTDASNMKYSNYANDVAVDGCAAMNAEGKWNIRSCTSALPFVCQVKMIKKK